MMPQSTFSLFGNTGRPSTTSRSNNYTLSYWGRQLEQRNLDKMNARQLRGGMQVHAVPESERAIDATGQRLPWAYEYADPDRAPRRVPEEKGPFGRSHRRRTSRSRTTVTPSARSKQDIDAAENWKVIDDIFSRVRSGEEPREKAPRAGTTGADSEGALSQVTPAGQPTEVILYGYPPEYQYAAIDHYERVSQGTILEDYERYPAHSKFNFTLTVNRTHNPAAISKEALRKSKIYHGGEHWIKVTFDSAEAAERACHYSPHVIQGHIVYAEPYRGTGPLEDCAIPATEASIASITASPSQETSRTLQGVGGTSDTASSATATAKSMRDVREESASSSTIVQQPPASDARLTHRRSVQPPQTPKSPGPGLLRTRSPIPPSLAQRVQGHLHASSQSPTKRVRIPGVKGLEPQEKALLPAQSAWQKMFSHLPLLSLFLGGTDGIIGNEVPRKEDGTFDWQNAGFYWRFWAWVDLLLGTDFCGLRGDD